MRRLLRVLSPLRRLHWFTWCVTAVVATAMVLIVVPGASWDDVDTIVDQDAVSDVRDQVEEQLRRATSAKIDYVDWFVCEHGWPLPFLHRGLGAGCAYSDVDLLSPPELVAGRERSSPLLTTTVDTYSCHVRYRDEPVSWSNLDNWPLQGDVWRWNYQNLLIDIVVLLVAVGGSLFCVEHWIRWRGGLLRLRIIELLALMAIVAGGLGWWQYHAGMEERERTADEACHGVLVDHDGTFKIVPGLSLQNGPQESDYEVLFPNDGGFSPRMVNGYEYCGPIWLVRLLGNHNLAPDWLTHGTAVHIEVDPGYAAISKCPFIESVDVYHLPKSKLVYLQQLPRLRELSVSFEGVTTLEPLNNLSDLASRPAVLCPWELGELAVLEHLESLTLQGKEVLIEDLDAVAELSRLKELSLIGVSITEQEVGAFRRDHPDLQVQVIPRNSVQKLDTQNEILVDIERESRELFLESLVNRNNESATTDSDR